MAWGEPKGAPVLHSCTVCGRFGSCGMGQTWYCVPHAPEDFWPKRKAPPPVDHVGDVI